jgi:copper oxidase (laccase) domain-containing protein
VICVIHAGWRGSVNGIVKCAILQMREKYDLDLNSLFVFFGPCAKSCCYSVTQDFIDNLKGLSLPNNVFMERENKIYFDLPACNKFFLLEIGVCEKNISTQYNFCTICDNRFNSVRRNIGTLLRQPTIAVLK